MKRSEAVQLGLVASGPVLTIALRLPSLWLTGLFDNSVDPDEWGERFGRVSWLVSFLIATVIIFVVDGMVREPD
jgi:hypothetical protein